MKFVIKSILTVVVVYLVVMLGSGLAIRTLLSTSLGDSLRQHAQDALPVEFSLSGGELDLIEWMQFRPALVLYDLRIGNPAGYGDSPLLRADRVLARASLFDLLNDEAHVTSIQIDSPVIRVQTDAAGQTNVDALFAAADQSQTSSDVAESSGQLLIGSFLVRAGRVVCSSPGAADIVAKNVEIAAEDISVEQASKFSVQMHLFEEEAIAIHFAGTAGLVGSDSVPTQGHLKVDGALGQLPVDFRQEMFGTMLDDPGADSGVHIRVDLEGDLLGVVTGLGTIAFESIRLGRGGVAQLPLGGDAQLLLTVIDPVANPAFHLIMPDASLAFGQGRWQGGVETQYDGHVLSGKSVGGIEGVDINEMLTAFTNTPDIAFGRLKMPRYDIRFSGTDADELFRSLAGEGRLEPADGRFAIFDTLQTIESHAQKLLSGASAADGDTTFVEFASNLEVRHQRVYTSDIALGSDTLHITGDGSFGFDQTLDLDLDSTITGAVDELLRGHRDESGAAWVSVPLCVRGSLDAPSVRPDLGRLVRDEAVRQATGILGSLLGGQSDDESTDAEQEPPRLPFNLGDLLNR